jgi:hypothetical protein
MGGCCENRKENYHIQFDFRNTQNSINQNSKTCRENKLLIQYKLNGNEETNNIFKIKDYNNIDVPILNTRTPKLSSEKINVSLNKDDKIPFKKSLNIKVNELSKKSLISIKSKSRNSKKNSYSAEKIIDKINNTDTNKIYFPFDSSLKYSENSQMLFENTCSNDSYKYFNSFRKHRLYLENKSNPNKKFFPHIRNKSGFNNKNEKQLNLDNNDDYCDFSYVNKVNFQSKKEIKECK